MIPMTKDLLFGMTRLKIYCQAQIQLFQKIKKLILLSIIKNNECFILGCSGQLGMSLKNTLK